jgi:hypothetical protein
MDIITTLGFGGLAAAAVIAVVLSWPRRRASMNRFVKRSGSPARPDRRSATDHWFGDPVLFVGGDAGSADCSAGSDGGGGSCD